MKNALLQNIFE